MFRIVYNKLLTTLPSSRILPTSSCAFVTKAAATVVHYEPRPFLSSLSFSTTTSSSPPPSPNSEQQRPFNILGVQQIAIGHSDRTTLNHLWYNIFGLQPHEQNITISSENVCEDIIQLGVNTKDVSSKVEIDLMTPLDIDKSPKVHIPPLNHIGLWVDDLEHAVQYMTEQGVRFTPGGIRKGAAGYNVTFIHPKGNEQYPICGNGILIELVQAPEHIIATYKDSHK